MLGTAATRETIVVTHTDDLGIPDYTFNLTFAYLQKEGQWVGVCAELGTSTLADTLEQMQIELKEAVELQLNGIARITDVKDYLTDNDVEIVPSKLPKQAGFAIS